MTMFRMIALASASCAVLTACGGATDEGGATRVSAGSLYHGSTGSISGNTLPYAQKGVSFSDQLGRPFRVKVLRTVPTDDNGTEVTLSDAIVTVYADEFREPSFENIKITIDGETLVFENGASGPALGGEGWRTWSYAEGNAADAQGFYNTQGGGRELYSEAVFIVGLETDPGVIERSTSTLSYEGYSQAWGNLFGKDGRPIRDGITMYADTEFLANLAERSISGTVSGAVLATDVSPKQGFQGTFSADIVGNGFSSALAVRCNPVCDNNGSAIGGAFYGNGVATVAGLASLDFTIDGVQEDAFSAEETGRFVAAYGFAADQTFAVAPKPPNVPK